MADSFDRLLSAEELHRAADLVGDTGSEAEAGIAYGALQEFIASAEFPNAAIDPLSLCYGIMIGAQAMMDRSPDGA